jgi:enolase-phosphatase E1
VSFRLAARGVRAVLLDIEGTTTPIAFVHDVLVPYARAHLGAWLDHAAGSAAFTSIAGHFAGEHAADRMRDESVPAWRADTPAATRASIEAYARWLMDRDRKSPGLKHLQGLIWEQGYRAGLLRGEVFADVPVALHRWREGGAAIAIFSSGSELAQRRLFQSTAYGDLTPLISRFFDTAVGPKRDAASYRRVTAELARAPGDILFVSDVVEELAAADAAGQQTALSVRPGNPEQAGMAGFTTIHTFDELD